MVATVTADPRDLAQQWLTEKIRAFYEGRQTEPFTEDELAAELLGGVKVEIAWSVRRHWPDGGGTDEVPHPNQDTAEVWAGEFRQHISAGRAEVLWRPVLRLPAQPVPEESKTDG